MSKKILVSGIKPTGRLHFGNYFGAMKQNIDLANSGEYESYIFLADYHALTTVRNGDELCTQTIEATASYIACGLDISKANLFKQSDVRDVTELTWVFNNLVTMPFMMRAHSFKDRQFKELEDILKPDSFFLEKMNFINDHKNWDTMRLVSFFDRREDQKILEEVSVKYRLDVDTIRGLVVMIINIDHFTSSVNVGLFDYPVLMAADILIYGADVVPVGADQKQHVEYARDIAGYYNRAYNNEQFKLPKDYILESVATLPGVDGRKMSKSYNNHIELFCSEEELKKRVMSIVTDSAAPDEKKDPDTNNVYNIHKLFLTKEEDYILRGKFTDGGYGYKQAKDDLLATIMKWREGKIEIYNDLIAHPEKIKLILKDGGKVAREKAETTMEMVRKTVGLAF